MFIILVLLIILGAIYYLANDPSTLKKIKELSAQPTGKDVKVDRSASLTVKNGRKENSTRTAVLDATQRSQIKSSRTSPKEVGPSPSTEALKKEVENIEATTPNTAVHVDNTSNHSIINRNSGRMNLKDHHKQHSINNSSIN
uniref:RIC3 domain-containing protein n=1 Tax=Strongyloides stercoralis TaxID=6248 RepID=A0A0K0DW32_STRER